MREVQKMKLKYEIPDCCLIYFETEDLITLSSTDYFGIDFEDLI